MKLQTDLSGADLRRALERIGFVFQRQKGSHMVLHRETPHSRVVVPNHRRVRQGTLRQILHEAGLSVEQLNDLL
jgi:predicted RNA binding protein YcfA (HicA-like mRNA interferase family)